MDLWCGACRFLTAKHASFHSPLIERAPARKVMHCTVTQAFAMLPSRGMALVVARHHSALGDVSKRWLGNLGSFFPLLSMLASSLFPEAKPIGVGS